MARSRREKLTDLYGTAYSDHGQMIPFAKLYPEIEGLCIEIGETGKRPVSGRAKFEKANYAIVYDCHNDECVRGGVHIDRLVSAMVHHRETARQFEVKCEGYEESAKGARFYGPCLNRFSVTITIRYKEEKKRSDLSAVAP